MNNPLVIAIDPGKGGAAVAMLPSGAVLTYDCPESQIEFLDIADDLKTMGYSEIIAILEKVHAMPGQGVVSVWSFSANYTTWQMALLAKNIPFIEVSPQRWMKVFGDLPKDKKERKAAIKDRMQKRYPGVKVTLKNADALAMLSVAGKLIGNS